MTYLHDARHTIEPAGLPEIETAPVDHLADIADVQRGEPRVRTQHVLARLIAHNPNEYGSWTFSTLAAVLADHGIKPRKSDGVKVVRAEDLNRALANRSTDDHDARDSNRERQGSQGYLPAPSLPQSPWPDQQKPASGMRADASASTAATPAQNGPRERRDGSLPAPGLGQGGADDG